jgi:N-acetylneuraminic acid mutarotase
MIVWGGEATNTFAAGLRSGGRYDPASDTWTDTPLTNAPANRYQQTAVWTGTEMIVWGGYGLSGALNTGARFNPGSNSWTQLSLSGAPSPRARHTAVWTGTDMIIWGDTSDAARYSPVADAWTPVTGTGAPAARYSHTAVWTGSEMIICGGSSAFPLPNEAITYSYIAPRKLYVYLLP